MTERVLVIVNNSDYLRVHTALRTAATLQSMGVSVTVFFTHYGVLRLTRNRVDDTSFGLGSEVREGLEQALVEGEMERIIDLLRMLRIMGGKVYVCPTALRVHGLKRSDLVDEIDEVKSLSSVLEENIDSRIIVF